LHGALKIEFVSKLPGSWFREPIYLKGKTL
jgi:hypothetical protein